MALNAKVLPLPCRTSPLTYNDYSRAFIPCCPESHFPRWQEKPRPDALNGSLLSVRIPDIHTSHLAMQWRISETVPCFPSLNYHFETPGGISNTYCRLPFKANYHNRRPKRHTSAFLPHTSSPSFLRLGTSQSKKPLLSVEASMSRVLVGGICREKSHLLRGRVSTQCSPSHQSFSPVHFLSFPALPLRRRPLLPSAIITQTGGSSGGDDSSMQVTLRPDMTKELTGKGAGDQITPPAWGPDGGLEAEVEDEPYIPEVNEGASLKEDLLKELSNKGPTSVRVEGICKTFVSRSVGERQVLRDVSLEVAPGTMVALVGTSGSGKTTLMRVIAGLEPPTRGKVLFDGVDVTDVRVQDRDVGVMFQSYALFQHMTVSDNVMYGLNTKKRKGELTEAQKQKRVDDLLDLIQLPGLGARYPRQLSGGQRQRVALARALATQPRVLLLDEPFGALDAIVRSELRGWVRKLQKALKITTIFVTHDQEEALEMADVMVVFHRGVIQQMGPPFDIFRRPSTPFVKNFVCDPNIFRSSSLAVRRSGLRTAKPFVLVRPDDVVFFNEEKRVLNTTPATVTLARNLGPEVEVEITFDDGEMLEFLRMRYDWEEAPLEVGQRVHLQLKPMHLMPFYPEELKGGDPPV
eukprot:TRINITY_DN1019_c0_g2_i1.p1 TRINITY_DN1019_c0_g2~~TRINITY_DN1019_c0_g2_i1.p1  ORF type:complete len:634 (-),score=63.93 TRINITY_DN1019_c0_g2_i1:591-2492(-)